MMGRGAAGLNALHAFHVPPTILCHGRMWRARPPQLRVRHGKGMQARATPPAAAIAVDVVPVAAGTRDTGVLQLLQAVKAVCRPTKTSCRVARCTSAPMLRPFVRAATCCVQPSRMAEAGHM